MAGIQIIVVCNLITAPLEDDTNNFGVAVWNKTHCTAWTRRSDEDRDCVR
jgi:hypothetical protein